MEIKAKYLNGESAQDGDIITILNEGTEENIEYKGKPKTIYNFIVSNGRYELIYSPGVIAQKELIRVWGLFTEKWIGRKFQVKLSDQITPQGIKKVIFPLPIL